ncbi:MAG: pyruvate, phosphate dikinase/phosphoenolpyruvate synthase regulator [Planctomycetales bacterium]|nr:pyruvate, phosphate dikinase/phosphoenolpyruvate synthase regulator [Planctomycetales bacterium]
MPASTQQRSAQTLTESTTFDVHTVSEATGSLAEHLASVGISQFPKIDFRIHRHMFCSTIDDVRSVRKKITETTNPIVLSAIASSELKRSLKTWCERREIPYLSLLDGLVDFMSDAVKRRPVRDASLVHKCSESYFRRIDAWEYTLQHDDSRRLDTLDQADIILIGVSRVGKSPLAAYLGSLGYKVANVAITPELPVPRQVRQCRRKAIGLTLQPKQLAAIRERRFELNQFKDALGRVSNVQHEYLTPRAAIRDISFSDAIFRRLAIPKLDVTNLTVEESAAHALQLLNLAG